MGDSDSDVEEVHQRLERDNLVFKHSMSVPLATEDSDAWDDSALLEAYDTAVSSHAVCFVSTLHSPLPGGGNICALPPFSVFVPCSAASPLPPHSAAELRRAEWP